MIPVRINPLSKRANRRYFLLNFAMVVNTISNNGEYPGIFSVMFSLNTPAIRCSNCRLKDLLALQQRQNLLRYGVSFRQYGVTRLLDDLSF